MKPAYASISNKTGAVNGGICSIKIAPRDWLSAAPVVDFISGKITTAITFISGKDWLSIEFIPQSYDYDETEKASKSGRFYEIKISGIINYCDADLQNVLETMRYNQFIMKVMDRDKKINIIGLQSAALIPLIARKNTNASSGTQYTNFSFTFETENAPPFYEV